MDKPSIPRSVDVAISVVALGYALLRLSGVVVLVLAGWALLHLLGA